MLKPAAAQQHHLGVSWDTPDARDCRPSAPCPLDHTIRHALLLPQRDRNYTASHAVSALPMTQTIYALLNNQVKNKLTHKKTFKTNLP